MDGNTKLKIRSFYVVKGLPKLKAAGATTECLFTEARASEIIRDDGETELTICTACRVPAFQRSYRSKARAVNNGI